MNVYVAFKRYFDAAQTAETPTWRTVYVLGLMCATAVDHGGFVAFVGEAGYGNDWPDPRPGTSTNRMRRRTD
jgi:hypothetical protein